MEGQESGVTEVGFRPVDNTRFEMGQTALVPSGGHDTSWRELGDDPGPEARRRKSTQPAFIKPASSTYPDYLATLLTVLHEIPVAREALLSASPPLRNYGQDHDWWQGTFITTPRVVSLDEGMSEQAWDEILYESQRLMAFLDNTTRAYGSVNPLRTLCTEFSTPEDMTIGNYLQIWRDAALRMNPEFPLADIFKSVAHKQPASIMELEDNPVIHSLSIAVELENDKTLYDAIDEMVWCEDSSGTPDDVWLESTADVFTMRLYANQYNVDKLDIDVPATWYPDRYLKSSRDATMAMRKSRHSKYRLMASLDNRLRAFKQYPRVNNNSNQDPAIITTDLFATTLSALRRDGESPDQMCNGTDDPDEPEDASAPEPALADELEKLAASVEKKLEGKLNTPQTYRIGFPLTAS